jgi:hypothetical protein
MGCQDNTRTSIILDALTRCAASIIALGTNPKVIRCQWILGSTAGHMLAGTCHGMPFN